MAPVRQGALRIRSRWVPWVVAGIVSELVVALVVRELSIRTSITLPNTDAGIELLSALLGFVTFGALAVGVSIDLSERYAADFGQDVAELLAEDDPDRDRILGLIVLVFGAAVTGLLLATVTTVPGFALELLPAVLAIVLMVDLIGYVAARFQLLREEHLRAAIVAILERRLDADARALDVPVDQAGVGQWARHHRMVADYSLLADLTIRLLQRDSTDAASQTFAALLRVLDERAEARRGGKKRDVQGPYRSRPTDLGADEGALRRPPDWLEYSSVGAVRPTHPAERTALWFEDVATEILAAVLRKAARLNRRLFVYRGIEALNEQATEEDPLLRQFLAEVLRALAGE